MTNKGRSSPWPNVNAATVFSDEHVPARVAVHGVNAKAVTVARPFHRAVEGAWPPFAEQSCAEKVERRDLHDNMLAHHDAGMPDDVSREPFGRGGRSIASRVLALVPIESRGIVAVPAADFAAHFVGDQFHSMNS
jgi:hypothetical protein